MIPLECDFFSNGEMILFRFSPIEDVDGISNFTNVGLYLDPIA